MLYVPYLFRYIEKANFAFFTIEKMLDTRDIIVLKNKNDRPGILVPETDGAVNSVKPTKVDFKFYFIAVFSQIYLLKADRLSSST